MAVDVKAVAQALAGRIRHHDHLISQRHDRLENRTLMSP